MFKIKSSITLSHALLHPQLEDFFFSTGEITKEGSVQTRISHHNENRILYVNLRTRDVVCLTVHQLCRGWVLSKHCCCLKSIRGKSQPKRYHRASKLNCRRTQDGTECFSCGLRTSALVPHSDSMIPYMWSSSTKSTK